MEVDELEDGVDEEESEDGKENEVDGEASLEDSFEAELEEERLKLHEATVNNGNRQRQYGKRFIYPS
ncbi:MAG: hypothetical protein K6E59_01405 [Bacilli bacterium]|nr:hypothetical protein [Bacilli bacterium]